MAERYTPASLLSVIRSGHAPRAVMKALALSIAAAVLVVALPAGAQDDREEEARALFMAGRAAYDAGRYEAALDRFQEAYELSGRPSLLYNIGQAADRLRMDQLALESFEEFLAETPPETRNRDVAQRRVEFLRRSVAENRPEPSPEPEQSPEPEASVDAEPEPEPTPNLDPATMDGEDLALEDSEPEPVTSSSSDEGGIATKWWFWTIVGVVVVGAAVGIGVAAAGGDDPDPQYAESDIDDVIFALERGR